MHIDRLNIAALRSAMRSQARPLLCLLFTLVEFRSSEERSCVRLVRFELTGSSGIQGIIAGFVVLLTTFVYGVLTLTIPHTQPYKSTRCMYSISVVGGGGVATDGAAAAAAAAAAAYL